MGKKKKVLNMIIEQGILPLYFHPDAAVSVQVLKALYRAGIRVVEYTNRGETALENFLQLRKIVDTELPGLYLGVGTIKNKIEATEYVNEGADFVICPGVIDEVATIVYDNDLLWIPCCLTATEIILAEDLDAKLIKLFPGSLLGPTYVTEVKEIFPDMLFISTGGVNITEESIGEWFAAGASVIGLGSRLISKNLMEERNYGAIETLANESLQIVRRIKDRL
jgi:2-dehydro-3-deoxyphosphogluconate aldolase/(4S)-4-hydroxy-2-oxoglutarate aldolase